MYINKWSATALEMKLCSHYKSTNVVSATCSAYMAALPKHSQLNSETNICDKIPCFLGNQTWVTLTNHQLLHYTNQCVL